MRCSDDADVSLPPLLEGFARQGEADALLMMMMGRTQVTQSVATDRCRRGSMRNGLENGWLNPTQGVAEVQMGSSRAEVR